MSEDQECYIIGRQKTSQLLRLEKCKKAQHKSNEETVTLKSNMQAAASATQPPSNLRR